MMLIGTNLVNNISTKTLTRALYSISNLHFFGADRAQMYILMLSIGKKSVPRRPQIKFLKSSIFSPKNMLNFAVFIFSHEFILIINNSSIRKKKGN